MSWKNKVNIRKLREKAKRAIVTDVEKNLDKIRDKIFSEAKKAGGWRAYINTLQKNTSFPSG